MEINSFLLGADPELFIINEKTNKVVSAVGLIPGEKGNPYTDDTMDEGFGLETDNILAEFNIPPAYSEDEFIDSINFMKDYINNFVKNINPDLGILCAASQEVDSDQLQSEQAKEFGCSVDYNVYTERANKKPNGANTNLRSAGNHLHFSYNNANIDTSLDLVKYFDMYIGIPSILKDTDVKRRNLYGKAGCFRLKDYGVEYRVLSSAMMNDDDTLSFIWKQLIKAINAYNRGEELISPDLVQKAINYSDVLLAKELIKKYSII